LHRPDSGRVLVDGGDPGSDDRLRRRVAVIFQEFRPLPPDAPGERRMAMLGDHREEDVAAVVPRALHDATGDPVLARVGGWDRVLSGEYAGGTDLSGGQWQRVALGPGTGRDRCRGGRARPGRAHRRARRTCRGPAVRQLPHRHPGPDHDPGQPPPVQRPTRGPDRGPRRRSHRGGRHPRRAGRLGRRYARMFALQAERFALAGGEVS
jgi:ATP-binding cassette subfamily B protein